MPDQAAIAKCYVITLCLTGPTGRKAAAIIADGTAIIDEAAQSALIAVIGGGQHSPTRGRATEIAGEIGQNKAWLAFSSGLMRGLFTRRRGISKVIFEFPTGA